jgi:hypothetical protein
MPRLALIAAIAVVASLAGAAQTVAPPAGERQSFTGTLTATGRRDTVPQEDGATASTTRWTGSLVITAGADLRRGFRVEAIGFEDGQGNGLGRAVWTDDRGERLFSRITGGATTAGRRATATFTGGTGRYAGVRGEYSFAWQYVLPGEQGHVQARTVALSGTYRQDSPR